MLLFVFFWIWQLFLSSHSIWLFEAQLIILHRRLFLKLSKLILYFDLYYAKIITRHNWFLFTAIVCDAPNDFNAALVRPSSAAMTFAFNSTVQFSCIAGYEPVNGSTVRTCTLNKTWSEKPLECDRKLDVTFFSFNWL